MKRPKLLVACLLLGVLLAACAPVITIDNNTAIQVRAIVTTTDGDQAVSPSPGNSSSVDAGTGDYSVTVVVDRDWVTYAQTARKVLSEALADPSNLTEQQVLQITQRLKDIDQGLNQFITAASVGDSCSGTLSQNGGGTVTVSTDANGQLAVTCS
jgi:hypothetical protein